MKRFAAVLSLLLLLQWSLVGAGMACGMDMSATGHAGAGASTMHHGAHGGEAGGMPADAGRHPAGHAPNQHGAPCGAHVPGEACAPMSGCAQPAVVASAMPPGAPHAAAVPVLARDLRLPPSPSLGPDLPPPRG